MQRPAACVCRADVLEPEFAVDDRAQGVLARPIRQDIEICFNLRHPAHESHHVNDPSRPLHSGGLTASGPLPPRLIKPPRGRYYCPVALPWFGFMRQATPGARLRAAAYTYIPPRCRWPSLTRLRYLVQWPLLAMLAAWRAQRCWGEDLARLAGIGRWQQWRESAALAIAHNVPPHTYYLFRLWEPDRRRLAPLFLYEFESQPLLRGINRHADTGLLKDKERFHAACITLGLPAVRNIASFGADGREQWPGQSGQLPPCDLFVKRPDGLCGAAAECWRYSAARGTWRNGPTDLSAESLLACLRAQARCGGRLLQPRLVNHPVIATLSAGALCTLRIVTFRRRGSPARYFQACLRMPHGGEPVDNFTPGGVAAAVLPTGELGPAARACVGLPFDRHPGTGAQITGTRIPHWEAARNMALAAHDALAFDGTVGWDVAVTPAGPVLVEGNPTWGTEVMQASHHAPLGATAMPAMVREFLEDPARVRRSHPA